MKTYTNYAPGTRGITVNSDTGPYIHYLDPGQSVKLDPKDVIAASDLGKPGDEPSLHEADADALNARMTELKKQVESLTKPAK